MRYIEWQFSSHRPSANEGRWYPRDTVKTRRRDPAYHLDWLSRSWRRKKKRRKVRRVPRGEESELGVQADQGAGVQRAGLWRGVSWGGKEGAKETQWENVRDLQLPACYSSASVCDERTLGQGKSYPRGFGGTCPGLKQGWEQCTKESVGRQGSVHRGLCSQGGGKITLG